MDWIVLRWVNPIIVFSVAVVAAVSVKASYPGSHILVEARVKTSFSQERDGWCACHSGRKCKERLIDIFVPQRFL